MDKETAVCFTGHRHIEGSELEEISARLYSAVCNLILRGYNTFICGGAIGFDTLAADCIISFKKRFPHIKLVLALPCRDQTVKWNNLSDIAKYKSILGAADSVYYASPLYTDGCMLERNRLMVDSSSVCIAYMKHKRGGTAYTYKYAKSIGLRIINLYDNSDSEQLSFI